jgi:hypothetical protein
MWNCYGHNNATDCWEKKKQRNESINAKGEKRRKIKRGKEAEAYCLQKCDSM